MRGLPIEKQNTMHVTGFHITANMDTFDQDLNVNIVLPLDILSKLSLVDLRQETIQTLGNDLAYILDEISKYRAYSGKNSLVRD